MKITISHTAEERREAKMIEAFTKGLVPDAAIRKSEYPWTHGDRIRAMSDEELARLFAKAPLCRAGETRVDCRSTKSCLECLTEWLRQPAKEET